MRGATSKAQATRADGLEQAWAGHLDPWDRKRLLSLSTHHPTSVLNQPPRQLLALGCVSSALTPASRLRLRAQRDPREGAIPQLRLLSFPPEEGKFEASRRFQEHRSGALLEKHRVQTSKPSFRQVPSPTTEFGGISHSLGSRRGGPPRPQRFGEVRG